MNDPTVRRWLRLTPGRLLVLLLAIEGMLWLANWFRWLPKGCAVLIAVVSVGVFFLVMLGWFVLALVLRWRFQFSIRSLLVLVVAVALPFSWLATEMKAAGKQRELVGWVENVGYVYYDYEPDPFGKPVAQPPSPAWLRELFGENFFADVTAVFFRGRDFSDVRLERLRGFMQLQWLSLSYTQVSDAELEHSQGIHRTPGTEPRQHQRHGRRAGTPQGIDATPRAAARQHPGQRRRACKSPRTGKSEMAATHGHQRHGRRAGTPQGIDATERLEPSQHRDHRCSRQEASADIAEVPDRPLTCLVLSGSLPVSRRLLSPRITSLGEGRPGSPGRASGLQERTLGGSKSRE